MRGEIEMSAAGASLDTFWCECQKNVVEGSKA